MSRYGRGPSCGSALLVAVALWGCAGGTGEPRGEPPAVLPGQETPEPEIPLGRGSLPQDAFTIELRSGALRIQMTPLAEEVIRLAAPDTYTRLSRIASLRDDPVGAREERNGNHFLVSFFSTEPATRFRPEALIVRAQGRRLRASAIEPITSGWADQRLDQNRPEMAVYEYPDRIDLDRDLEVEYEGVTSRAWEQIRVRLEAERVRVMGGRGRDTTRVEPLTSRGRTS